mmetsp:Transcript_146318/g.469383  ORF Transcript_146318/g.469383 Transcript_146318/m.469383 type:complete len:867 (+) Transcript_146318:179-2779(+)
MREEVFRQIVKEEGKGLDILPDGISEPELLLKAIMRKWLAERKLEQGKVRQAEYTSQQKMLDCEAMRKNMDEIEHVQKNMSVELSSTKRKVGFYEAKIAFLGKHWEELTGEVNDMLHKDPDTRARQCKAEMESTKTLLFNTELSMKMQQKKVDALMAKNKEQDAAIARWSTDVINSNEYSKELESQNLQLQAQVNDLTAKLKSTSGSLASREQEVRDLGGKLSVSNIQLKDTNSCAEQLNMRCVKVARDLTDKESNLGETKALVQKSADDRLGLQERLTKCEAALAEANADLADTKKRLNAKEVEAKYNEDELKKKIAELNNVYIEFAGVQDVANRLGKDNKAGAGRLKDEQTEVEALKSGLQKTVNELAGVQERLKASEAEAKKLKSDLAMEKQEHRSSEALAASLDAQTKATGGRLTTTTAEFQQLQVVTNRLEKDLRDKQGDLRASEDRVEQLSVSMRRSADEIQATTKRLDASEAEKRKMKEELAGVQQQLRASETSLAQLEGIYKRASADLNISKQNLDSAGSTVNTLTKDVRTRTTQLDEYESEMSACRANMDRLAAQLSGTEAKLQESQARDKDLSGRLKERESGLRRAEESVKALTEQNDRFAFEIDNVRKNKQIESEQGRKLQKEVEGRESVILDRNADIEQLQQKYALLGDDFQALQEKHSASVGNEKKLRDEMQALKKRLFLAEGLAADRERIYNRTQGELDLARQDYNCIGAQSKELAKVAKAKESAVQVLESEASVAKASAASLAQQLQSAEGTVRDLSKQMKTAEERLLVAKQEARNAEGKAVNTVAASKAIVNELEASQLRLRESDVLVRKLTSELRHQRERLQDSDTERSVLSNNVNRLMEEFRKLNGVL